MTLRISLKAGEQVVVNGAVLRAIGRTSLCIESRAAILRGRDLMTAADATTPARRLYLACITAYTDRDNDVRHQATIVAALEAVIAAMPSQQALAAATSFAHRVAVSDHYRALTDCRTLIAIEAVDILPPHDQAAA